MKRYAALLRGVNAGRVIKMADLRACLESLGLRQVRTVLQSGNVLFESPAADPAALKRRIEAGLSETFHYPAKAQVLTLDGLARAAAGYPFGTAAADQHDYVIFCENGLEKALAAETYELAAGEQVAAGDGVVYWRVAKGQTLKSDFAKWLGRPAYRDFNTNRNLRTLQKMLAA